MPSIRIIGVPPGEAPESVRQAWVGLSLPVAKGQGIKPKQHLVGGALSGPKGLWPILAALVFKRYETWQGYGVDALTALEILSESHPEAANWWYSQAPHLVKPGQKLVFPADVYELEA